MSKGYIRKNGISKEGYLGKINMNLYRETRAIESFDRGMEGGFKLTTETETERKMIEVLGEEQKQINKLKNRVGPTRTERYSVGVSDKAVWYGPLPYTVFCLYFISARSTRCCKTRGRTPHHGPDPK